MKPKINSDWIGAILYLTGAFVAVGYLGYLFIKYL